MKSPPNASGGCDASSGRTKLEPTRMSNASAHPSAPFHNRRVNGLSESSSDMPALSTDEPVSVSNVYWNLIIGRKGSHRQFGAKDAKDAKGDSERLKGRTEMRQIDIESDSLNMTQAPTIFWRAAVPAAAGPKVPLGVTE
jgi:hypothetical protein